MLEISVTTTDQSFVQDFNSAGIEGVRADYRPTMAFDSFEHVLQIVVESVTAAGLKLAIDWIIERRKKAPTNQITVNSQVIENSGNVIIIINNPTDIHDEKKD
jgi:hypothetical protein